MQELEATVKGRVQMVMFRDFTQRKARGLGICGFVRNNRNGTVTVIAQGDLKQLESLLAYLRKGSLFSKVESVDTSYRSAVNTYKDFIISYS